MVVTHQLRKSGGMWLEMGDKKILIDPGPGCLMRCVELGFRPRELDCVVLSHRHIDHSNDVNIMLEAMSGGGFKPRGILVAPEDCLEGEDPVVLRYIRKYIHHNIFIIKKGFRHTLGSVTIEAPIRLNHADVESYGLKFTHKGLALGYISDTKYFERIGEAFKGYDALIINMVRLTHDDRFQHLVPEDVLKIVKVAKPDMAILTHFGMQIVKSDPEGIAAHIEKESGVRTIAAKDGMRFELSDKRHMQKTLPIEGYAGIK
jgi:ribonuclease BN (tRNA processing enzyme)